MLPVGQLEVVGLQQPGEYKEQQPALPVVQGEGVGVVQLCVSALHKVPDGQLEVVGLQQPINPGKQQPALPGVQGAGGRAGLQSKV